MSDSDDFAEEICEIDITSLLERNLKEMEHQLTIVMGQIAVVENTFNPWDMTVADAHNRAQKIRQLENRKRELMNSIAHYRNNLAVSQ